MWLYVLKLIKKLLLQHCLHQLNLQPIRRNHVDEQSMTRQFSDKNKGIYYQILVLFIFSTVFSSLKEILKIIYIIFA